MLHAEKASTTCRVFDSSRNCFSCCCWNSKKGEAGALLSADSVRTRSAKSVASGSNSGGKRVE